MGLSAFKEEARATNEDAKVELKGRRMLSASYRFKKQGTEELQRLHEEQQLMFEQVTNRTHYLYLRVDLTFWCVVGANKPNGASDGRQRLESR